MAWWTQPVLW
jgi:hypothetical protein